jgi:hypothetical protein
MRSKVDRLDHGGHTSGHREQIGEHGLNQLHVRGLGVEIDVAAPAPRDRGSFDRKERLAKLLAKAPPGIQYSEHLEGDGAAIFGHACKLGAEGIVSKHREHPYRSGPSKAWLKTKNPAAPGMLRFREEP